MRNQTNKIQRRYFVFSQYFKTIKNEIGYNMLAYTEYTIRGLPLYQKFCRKVKTSNLKNKLHKNYELNI